MMGMMLGVCLLCVRLVPLTVILSRREGKGKGA